MALSENEVIELLNEEGIDTSLVVSVNGIGGDQYEVAFETLEIEFDEDEIWDSLEEGGFEPEGGDYEAPSDRGFSDSPTDVFPYYYVYITVEEE